MQPFSGKKNRQMLREDEDMFEADTETTHNKKTDVRYVRSMVGYVRYVAEPALMFLAGRDGLLMRLYCIIRSNTVRTSQHFPSQSKGRK